MRRSLWGIGFFAVFVAIGAVLGAIGDNSSGDRARSGAGKAREGEVQVAQNPSVASTGNPSVAPLKWVGMLFNPTPTKKAPNLASTCTGQFIKPNIVLTAAHCIEDLPDNQAGPWYDLTKQTFVLQFQNGQGSHTFKTVCAATAPQWTLPSDYKSLSSSKQDAADRAASEHDFALVLVDGTSATGVMPYMLDWKGKVTRAVRIGYAADILNGEIIQQAYGVVFSSDAIPMFPESPPNLVVHWQSITDLTAGSSGGGWIANYSSTEGPDKNVLIAVTSFGNSRYSGAVMGAYLTAAEFNPLLQFVSNGCK